MNRSLILSLLLAAAIPFGANAQSQDGCIIMQNANTPGNVAPAPIAANGGAASGPGSMANGPGSVSDGNGPSGSTPDGWVGAHADGVNAGAHGSMTTASGTQANAGDDGATATGGGANAGGCQSTATGLHANAGGSHSTAQGAGANASAINAKADGAGSQATDIDTTADGTGSRATVLGASASGAFAEATAMKATANGAYAKARAQNCVASGANSECNQVNEYSVGNATMKRRVTNVANGRIDQYSTDAINGSQVWAMQQDWNDRWLTINNRVTNIENRIDGIENRLNGLDKRISGVCAMGQAMGQAALTASSIKTKNKIGLGAGYCGGEVAVSFGYQRDLTTPRGSPAAFSVGVSTTGKDTSVGLGWAFGW